MGVKLKAGSNHFSGVELVIFDKDGTLTDVHHYWANMIKFRAEIVSNTLPLNKVQFLGLMDSMGVDTRKMRIKPEGPVGIKKREVVLQSGADYLEKQGYNDTNSVLYDAFSEADRVSLSRLNEIIRPIKGLYRCINSLRKSACKIAIATTDRTDRTKIAMQHLNLLNEIDFIAGADMVRQPKPYPEIINLICRQLSIPAENSVMIGDAAPDIQSGINAGCRVSIGVGTGLTTKSQLRKLTPAVIDSIASIEVC